MTDPQLNGLLAACAAAVEGDDAPWLVLADLLDERGDARGAEVRAGRRWDARDRRSWAEPGDPDWPVRLSVEVRDTDRLDALLDERPDWVGPLVRLEVRLWEPEYAPSGFAESGTIRFSGPPAPTRLPEPFSQLTEEERPAELLRMLDRLATMPNARGLSLYESLPVSPEARERLAAWGALESLNLEKIGYAEETAPDLWDERLGIRQLRLYGCSPRFIERLHLLPRLTCLNLTGLDRLIPSGESLAACRGLRSLEVDWLDLGWAAELLPALPKLPCLRRLRLNPLWAPELAVAEPVGRCRGVERVTLDGHWAGPGDPIWDALAGLPALRRVSARNVLGAERLRAVRPDILVEVA